MEVFSFFFRDSDRDWWCNWQMLRIYEHYEPPDFCWWSSRQSQQCESPVLPFSHRFRMESFHVVCLWPQIVFHSITKGFGVQRSKIAEIFTGVPAIGWFFCVPNFEYQLWDTAQPASRALRAARFETSFNGLVKGFFSQQTMVFANRHRMTWTT